MPLRLTTCLRLWRRPAVALAAVLMIAQAFLAGLAGAQAGLFQVGGLAGDFAVICHGHGAVGSDPGGVPDPGQDEHLCCVACTAGAPPALLPVALVVLRTATAQPLRSPVLREATISITARAVRAGPSQAPPSLA
jgi:hypothetical protein